MIGIGAVAFIGVAGALLFFVVRRVKHYAGYSSTPTELKKAKKNLVKKFEDYWDEESEDQATQNPMTGSQSSKYEDYWEEKNELSSHSNHPLNIGLPRRI